MVKWLTRDEQAHWRAWLSATALLPDRFGKDLQNDHGLTMADYEILVRLSEVPERRMRMSELADVTLSSRSRLSHQIDRMHKAGLIDRQACPDDRRGQFALLTDHGFAVLEQAAPDHVRSVRRHLVDVLTPEEFAELGRISQKLVDHLE